VNAGLVGNVMVIAIELIVGGRLLRKALSRRAVPELLLGGQLLLDALEWICWLVALYTPVADTPASGPFAIGCRVGIALSIVCVLFFVRCVFRPKSRWALALAIGVSLMMATGLTVGVLLGDRMGFASGRIWIWLELSGPEIAMLWCVAEASNHHRAMRKRVAIGLADRVVANRLLLWCYYAAASAVSQFFYMVAVAIAGADGSYPFYLDTIMGIASSTGGILIWLAFFPPPAYLRWVSRAPALRAA